MANDVITTTRSPIVEISSGQLRGVTAAGIHAFKGIPYGASTAGANRFMPPQPPAPWSGVRDAVEYRGHAPQSPLRAEKRPELATTLGPPDATAEGEDCLSLNIWTPGLDNARRPVMVWLHGGAFAYGSGNRAVTAGENLARRGDVVVVSVNHRLNILGYLHLAERGGSRFAHSGNAGTLDLVAALQWVRDNIVQLGGDPGNVTIFGESGGGGKVSVLLAMPAAKGLFHKAVVQSGATIRVSTRERGAALADAVLKELGTDCDGLQQLPYQKIQAAMAAASRAVGPTQWKLLDRYDFGPVADGTDLPRQPFDPAAPAIAADIPLLIGGTREESGFFLADDDEVWHGRVTEESLRRRVTAIAGGEADRVLAAYSGGSPGDRLIAALTGANFWVRSVMLAERKAAQPAPVYTYSLDWRSPFQGGRLKAHHAMDLPFVFDTPDVPDTTKDAAGAPELAAVISKVWSTFARTGSPQTAAIPTWPTYDAATRATMRFDAKCRIDNDPDRAARLAWMRVVEAQG
ncbi:MAG TPA: carboxylesterase/lipase family protein [Stellaceae bacterium]|jgi:para-nitrobenzyl esterase|nr:carboxylesterase/lipase family protein [Stellaceae bacterium]